MNNGKLRNLLMLVVGSLLASCARGEGPRFELRNLELKTEKESYGTFYKYEGSLLQTVPANDERDYEVLLEVVRVSDGNPTDWPRDTVRASMVVHRGSGFFSWPGGTSSSSAGIDPGWKPARITVRVIGYQPYLRVVPAGTQ